VKRSHDIAPAKFPATRNPFEVPLRAWCAGHPFLRRSVKLTLKTRRLRDSVRSDG
jgi:hypothetical protein